MDPVSLIIAALIAGASAGAKATAATAVEDAYGALKGLIRRRLGRAEVPALEQPEAERERLAELLRDAGADRDEEVVRAAQAVLAQLDPAGARGGKYDVNISGGKGIVVGDAATVTMNFGDD